MLKQSAFLQERTYELCEGHLPLDFSTDWVPLAVVFLGHVSVLWSPPCLSYRQLLEWAGIFQFDSLIDENSDSLLLDGRVVPWKTVIVQQHPADVAFELDLLEGFGSDQDAIPYGLLRTTESWICTGLWHLDQIIKSQLLSTWSGLGFGSLTVLVAIVCGCGLGIVAELDQ